MSVEVRTRTQRGSLLKIAWLGNPPSSCGEFESDYLKTYCQQWLSLSDAAQVMPVPFNSHDPAMPSYARREASAFRRLADVLLIPPQCCMVPAKLTSCLENLELQAGDPPVVIMLNKVFEGLDVKFAAIYRLSLHHPVLLVTAPAPLDDSAIPTAVVIASKTRSPMRSPTRSSTLLPMSAPQRDHTRAVRWPPKIAFLGYGAGPTFYGQPSEHPYDYDLGFSGSPGRFDRRYAYRAETMGNTLLLARLREQGVRIYDGGMVRADQYIQTLSSTRMWLSTSEVGDHVVSRTYEVLASGRALLMCDRNPRAHTRLGIIEGVHAVMFNSSDEFEGKVRWYMEHEPERLRIVQAARALAASHTWGDRARELVVLIRKELHTQRVRGHNTSRHPVLAFERAAGRGDVLMSKIGALLRYSRVHDAKTIPEITRPFDEACEAAFVHLDSIAKLHSECSPRYDKHMGLAADELHASAASSPLRNLSWNCIGVENGTRHSQPTTGSSTSSLVLAEPALTASPMARNMLQGLCLAPDNLVQGSSTRIRLLFIHLNNRHPLSSHDTAPHHRASRPSIPPHVAREEALKSENEVATSSGAQLEWLRHNEALTLLMRDGVVRLDQHWGFARLILEQPITGRSESLRSWITRRLDALGEGLHLESRRHIAWEGTIPGIAPILQAVQATFGRLAQNYLGSDAVLSHYSAFRLPPNLDLAHYPAGFYHHDRCGHRLKAYLLLTRVTEESHPLRIALGSHRTLFYSHNDMLSSRFTDEYIESQYLVRSVTGEAGEGFLFDTNAVHKAGGVGLAAQGTRDVMLFEFNARGRSAEMCAVDHTLPCGCSHGVAAAHKPAINTSGVALSISATIHSPRPPAHSGSRRLSQAAQWDRSLWGCTRRPVANLSCAVLPSRERQSLITRASELVVLTRSHGRDMPEAVRLALQPPPPGRHYFAMSTYLPNAALWHRQRQLPKQRSQHARLRSAVRATFCDPRRPLDESQLRGVLGSARIKGGPLKYLVYVSEHAVRLAASGYRQGAQPRTPWLYARGLRGCHGSWTCFFTPSICPSDVDTRDPLNQSAVAGLELKAAALGTELQWPGSLIRAMHVALALEARLHHGLQPATQRAVESLLRARLVHNRGSAWQSSLRGAIIGMHVRRGDACETFDGYTTGPINLDAARSCYALDEYVTAARQLRQLYGTSSVINLISDSAEVIAMVKAYPDFEWRALDFDRDAVGHGTPNLQVSARARVYIEARAQAADPANKDIVHSALADLLFVAEAAVFVGTARSFVSKAAILLIWARTGVLPPTVSLEGDVLHSLLHTRGPFWASIGLNSGGGQEINDHGWIPCVYALPDVHSACFPCIQPPHGMVGPGRVDRCMDQSFLRALERDGDAQRPCTWQGEPCSRVAKDPIF